MESCCCLYSRVLGLCFALSLWYLGHVELSVIYIYSIANLIHYKKCGFVWLVHDNGLSIEYCWEVLICNFFKKTDNSPDLTIIVSKSNKKKTIRFWQPISLHPESNYYAFPSGLNLYLQKKELVLHLMILLARNI